jgi:hypothetical protein
MRVFGRTAVTGVLALVGAGMAGGQAWYASSPGYPPIERTVPAAQEPCTFAPPSIPPPPVPANQVQAIEKEVMALVGKHFDGIGQCVHHLLVLMLTPGSEVLAQKVRAKFGPSVQIMVGWTVWNGHPGRSATCGTLAAPTAAPAGYSTALDLRSRVIKDGADLQGHVTFHNPSTQSVTVLTEQPIEVVITRPGTRRVVGVYTSGIAGTAASALLVPGQSDNIDIVGGTGRCDGGIGSALPPGRYDAVAEVSGVAIDGPEGGIGGGPPPTYLTPFVPIQIVR